MFLAVFVDYQQRMDVESKIKGDADAPRKLSASIWIQTKQREGSCRRRWRWQTVNWR